MLDLATGTVKSISDFSCSDVICFFLLPMYFKVIKPEHKWPDFKKFKCFDDPNEPKTEGFLTLKVKTAAAVGSKMKSSPS